VNALNSFASLTVEDQISSLDECLATILSQYDLGDYETESINHEYNSTFKVTAASGEKFALRINVNSSRTFENLSAEIFWITAIESVTVPKPVLNLQGGAVSHGWHAATDRKLPAVLYTWLDGEEPGDKPTEAQLFALGASMAKLHLESVPFELPADSELPDYTDVFWGAQDNLCGPNSKLSESEQAEIAGVLDRIEKVIAELRGSSALQPIHADLHPWNVMWHEGELAIFDFDDSGLGLPIQDLMTAIYYLDTPEQDAALLAGYASIAPIPKHTPEQRAVLMLQRRLLLLNYLYETSNPEHLEMIPEYQAETMRRLRARGQQQ
jgi:Ser/Thr protein kinase RdoA (MazF antagonist)